MQGNLTINDNITENNCNTTTFNYILDQFIHLHKYEIELGLHHHELNGKH